MHLVRTKDPKIKKIIKDKTRKLKKECIEARKPKLTAQKYLY
jgi:hypothetical protein